MIIAMVHAIKIKAFLQTTIDRQTTAHNAFPMSFTIDIIFNYLEFLFLFPSIRVTFFVFLTIGNEKYFLLPL